MKRLLCTLIIVSSFPIAAYSQAPKFSLGIAGSSDFYYQNPLGRGYILSYIIDPNYSTGAEMTCSLTERAAIRTGLFYSRISFRYAWHIHPLPGSNEPVITLHGSVRGTYLDIPFLYDYYFTGSEKWSLYSTTGLIPAFILSADYRRSIHNSIFEEMIAFNPFSLSIQHGWGIRYRIHDRLDIQFEPRLRYFARSFETYLWLEPLSFNAALGISYVFKR
jgi:hypothetical protein